MNRLFAILARYRPLLNRCTYVLALLGVLVTVHLTVLASTGFTEGCMGGIGPAFLEGLTDCGAVLQSEAGTLLGLSNSVWGLLFYAVVASSSFSLLFLSRRWSVLLRALRAGLILFAFIYTAYLVYYQLFELEEICALCMVSAALVTGLLIVQLIVFFHRPRFSFARPSSLYKRRREARRMIGLAILVAAVAAADVVYFTFYAEPQGNWDQLLEEEFGNVYSHMLINEVQLLLK